VTRKVRLVCIPSADFYFGAHARELLAGIDVRLSPDAARAEFERLLRLRYEAAVVRPQDPLAARGPVDEMVWYATNRRFKSRISTMVEIPAPPEVVFPVYVDRFPDWQPALKLERVDGARGKSCAEYVATYELLGRRLEGRFTVVDADPPRSVRVEGKGIGGIRLWYATTFRPIETGTSVRVDGDYDIPGTMLPGFAVRVIEAAVRREVDRAHATLREFCIAAVTSSAASRVI